MFSCLDLFCGAGGLSKGFELANYKILGGIDFNKKAIETYKMNFSNTKNYYIDIKTLSNEEILNSYKNVDVIVGGCPCQGFSKINIYNKRIEDPRNDLFLEYIRFIELLQPKAFLLENVREIIKKYKGSIKDKIIQLTESLGYNVNYKTLLASDYGVPQNRYRVIFIGIKKDYNKFFDFNNLKTIEPKTTVSDALSDIIYGKDSNEEISNKYLEYIRDIDILFNHNIKFPNEKVIERLKYVPQGGNWKNVPSHLWKTQRNNRFSSVYRRLELDKQSPTIDGQGNNLIHPIFNRFLTVRECARLQSFPDSFNFCGTTREQMQQVGNAIPVLLAKVIANELTQELTN